MPYDKMWDNAIYGRAVKLYGASNEPKTTAWPQAHGYKTDIAKAKALLAEAGFGRTGFETTLSLRPGRATFSEPMAVLIQESLGRSASRLQINKIPGANWRAALLKKDMPMMINRFGGWLNYPEYFFFWCYHGQNAVFNTMSYQNPKLDKFITNARFAESKAIYDGAVRGDDPARPSTRCRASRCSSPRMDVAMQKDVSGYTYWFHLQPDYRQIVKN
jgi:peptide/nickel transport system substrate-binding protein